MQDQDGLREKLRRSLEDVLLSEGPGRTSEIIMDVFENYRIYESFYEPSRELLSRIEDYNNWCQTRAGEDAGRLMEEIACLAFICLKGIATIKGYQSASQQIDLVVAGRWHLLMEYLKIDSEFIVIEAKNTDRKVNDAQFSRLCSIIEGRFPNSCQLGVFFTRSGASGFPTKKSDRRERSLRDARATQYLFHARTKKFVIVLDHDDIQQLTELGALPKLLKKKINEVELGTGLDRFAKTDEVYDIDLPPHLHELVGYLVNGSSSSND